MVPKQLDLIRDCGQNSRRLCMTANQWRNALKYFKKMGKVVAANQQSAEAWLNDTLGR